MDYFAVSGTGYLNFGKRMNMSDYDNLSVLNWISGVFSKKSLLYVFLWIWENERA
jgi:hypothetical protein